MTTSAKRLIGVDIARGSAAALVFIHHLDVYFPRAWPVLLHSVTLFRLLKLMSSLNSDAVMLFFVISGFCIRATSTKYDFRFQQDILHYGVRRVVRIVPLYLIALVVTYGAGLAMGLSHTDSFSYETLIGNLLFLQTADGMRGTWFVPFGQNAPLWSLSYEVFYYVIFPSTMLVELWVFRNRHSMGGMISAFVLSGVSILLFQISPNPFLSFLSLYFVWRIGVSIFDSSKGAIGKRRLILVLMLLSAPTICILLIHGSATLELIVAGLVIGCIWLLLQDWRFSRIVRVTPVRQLSKAMAWLGTVSYALYLLHYPIVRALSYGLNDTPVALMTAIVLSLLAAAAAELLADRLKNCVLARTTTATHPLQVK